MQLVWCDEVLFTKKTFPTTAWGMRNQHIKVESTDVFVDYVAVVASVSSKLGVIHLMVEYGAINAQDWLKYIKALHKKMDYEPFALYFDQLNVHKDENLQAYCENHGIMRIFNVSYSPEFNAIETIFSRVKNFFRKERLNKLANGEYFDFEAGAKKAFKPITPDFVKSCANRSIALLHVPIEEQ